MNTLPSYKKLLAAALLPAAMGVSFLTHANSLEIHVNIQDADSVPRLHMTDGQNVISNLGSVSDGDVKSYLRQADQAVGISFDPTGAGNFTDCEFKTRETLIPADENKVVIEITTQGTRACHMYEARNLTVNTYARGIDDSADSITFNLNEYTDADQLIKTTDYAVAADSWSQPVRHQHALSGQDYATIDLVFNGQVEQTCAFTDGSEPTYIRDLSAVDLVVYGDTKQCVLATDWKPPVDADVAFKTIVLGAGEQYDTQLVFSDLSGLYYETAEVIDGIFRQNFDKTQALDYTLSVMMADGSEQACQYNGETAIIDDSFSPGAAPKYLTVDVANNLCEFGDEVPVTLPIPLEVTYDIKMSSDVQDINAKRGSWDHDGHQYGDGGDATWIQMDGSDQKTFTETLERDAVVATTSFNFDLYSSGGARVGVAYCKYEGDDDYSKLSKDVLAAELELLGPGDDAICYYRTLTTWDDL